MEKRDRKKSMLTEENREELIEKVVAINRVSKVVKGGKRFSFSALVVVGNGKGKVGFGYGKANEIADAIRKGFNDAKKSFVNIPLKGTSIPHEVLGRWKAAKLIMKPASEGTGVIAGGAVRAVCDATGIKDILTKSLKSNNPTNLVKAAVFGLSSLKTDKI